MMSLLASEIPPISNKDVLSFTFDDPTYDEDQPVFLNSENPDIYLSHRSAKQLIRKLIAGLHANGLKYGDTVCVHGLNSIWYPSIVLAIIGAGGLAVSTNPAYTRLELDHAIKVAKIKFVFADPEVLSNMLPALQSNNVDTRTRVWMLEPQAGQAPASDLQSWRTLLDHGDKDWIRFNDEQQSKDTAAQLYYTSGTTGLPKCAVVTHYNLVAEHQLVFETDRPPHQRRNICVMPFFHMGAAPAVIVSTFKEGRMAYVMRRFELETYLKNCAKYKANEINLVPPMVTAIVMSGLADPKSKAYREDCSLKSVRAAFTGAAPCSSDLQQRCIPLFGEGATFTQVWGMTETTCIATMVPWNIIRQPPSKDYNIFGHSGTFIPCLTWKLINPEGQDVTSQGKGELCVKGPTVVKGYFENEKATKESWDAEGFFMTGDVVEVDKDTGSISVVDRVKELIKVKGFQVAPPELEGALLEHPDIVDAAVIGLKLSDELEAPKAFVVRRKGTRVTAEDVQKHMKQRLSHYKQLTGGVEFVDEVPKSPSGKILKRILRERVAREATGKPKL